MIPWCLTSSAKSLTPMGLYFIRKQLQNACASSLISELYGHTVIFILFKYYIFCWWGIQRSIVLITKVRHRKWFESDKSNYCLHNQFVQNPIPSMSGFPKWYFHLRFCNQNFVSIISLHRTCCTPCSSYPPTLKYRSNIKRWKQICDYLIPNLTTIQKQYKYIYSNDFIWINYHTYTMNKILATIAYLQSVNFRHVEVMYKLLASTSPYHFSVLTLLLPHVRNTKHITPSILKTL
jgi:hypothetical protein